MFSLRRPSPAAIAAALAAARTEHPAYDGVGSTRSGTAPPGYRVVEVRRHVGSGQRTFDAAVAALDAWAAQRHAGVEVHPVDARPDEGTTVLQLLRLGPLWATAACRVVYRISEPDRAGYAYGTLSRHPVRGEEAFLVERDAAGVVRVRILAFSRPRHWLTRLGGPVGRLVQRRTAARYAEGVVRAAR